MTIELSFLPVDVDHFAHPSSKARALFKQALESVAYQPGFKAFYWGFQVKNPSILQLITHWDSPARPHKSYTGSPAFAETLKPILTGAPEFYTAYLSPDPTPMLRAPATEVVMITGPFDDFEESLGKFGANCLAVSEGYVGGTSVGDVEDRKGDDVKRKYILVGWQSVQHQKNMMTTEIFKENVTLVSKHCDKVALDYVEFKNTI